MTAAKPERTHRWPLVLSLVGLDYFSTLAYLPSIAVQAAGWLAPLAALWIVLVTLVMALPIYCYVVGRSPHGRGATGLLERLVPGWGGKLLMLVLLGFAAADFVVTRSLSIADATTHLVHNVRVSEWLDTISPNREAIEQLVGHRVWSLLAPAWTRQMGVTLGLSMASFVFWWLAHGGFTRKVLWLAAIVVTLYMVLSGVVIVAGLVHIFQHPELGRDWLDHARERAIAGGSASDDSSVLRTLASLALWTFPQLALGLSGFELTMTVAPLVEGEPDDDPEHPRGRIRNTRKLMLCATLIMAVFILGSVTVVTILVPSSTLGPDGSAEHRALAYLAHGEPANTGVAAGPISPLFGHLFGALYDIAAVAILCLAGGSVINGLRNLLPHFLHRLGMELSWTGRFSVMMHLLNAMILIVTLVFHADLTAQQGAYATSVLVLLTGAAVAATIDLRRAAGLAWRQVLAIGAPLICAVFLTGMTLLTITLNGSGLAIALAFVATMTTGSMLSRWIRSTELRFEGFRFADEHSRGAWEALRQREIKVLAPHRPGLTSLAEKDALIRREHRLPVEISIVYIEASLGDPSEFYHTPLVNIGRHEGFELIRVSRCVSVAHVVASIALELGKGQPTPPELIFGWSEETPLAANWNFLLFGEGNIPWMVRALIRRAERDPVRQPRIVIR